MNESIRLNKRRSASMTAQDRRIVQKFYYPYIVNKQYIINLNNDSQRIKKNTRQYVKMNAKVEKKHKEVDEIARKLFLYSNPNINLDALSQQTYDKVVRNVINIQNSYKRKHTTPTITTK